MMNVLGLPLDRALALLGTEAVQVEELKGRPPRKNTNESAAEPREIEPRGTLRIVRQREGVLTVCRFPDTASEETDENLR